MATTEGSQVPAETKEGQPKPSMVLLDGSKGAGKTTVGDILAQRLSDSSFLTLDNERRALPPSERSITERNKEAFENLMVKAEQQLDGGMSLIIDCGLTDERVTRITALAATKGLPVHKFLLKASYETQLNRVRARDAAKGNQTDEARFAEVHGIIHSKSLDDFTVIDTDTLAPDTIADAILKAIAR